MPWTVDNQEIAKKHLQDLSGEYWTAYAVWQQAVVDAVREPAQSKVGAAVANVQNKIQAWRSFVRELQESSNEAVAHGDVLTDLNALAAEVAEQKETLKKLRSEAGTREEQSDSLNPKVKPSPYVNILGLSRTFRDNTRFGILMASIVFGVLCLGLIVALAYISMQKLAASQPTVQSQIQVAGKR